MGELLSSKSRLLYGEKECLETIQKICPDSKDRGAYGSIFLGACKNAIHEKLNILVVDDSTEKAGEIPTCSPKRTLSKNSDSLSQPIPSFTPK